MNSDCLTGISDAFSAFCLRVSVIFPTCLLYPQQKCAYSGLQAQAWTYIHRSMPIGTCQGQSPGFLKIVYCQQLKKKTRPDITWIVCVVTNLRAFQHQWKTVSELTMFRQRNAAINWYSECEQHDPFTALAVTECFFKTRMALTSASEKTLSDLHSF